MDLRSLQNRIRVGLQQIRNLNLFPSNPPTNDQHQLTNQIISTRLFLFAFIVAFIILVTYTSSITITKAIIHKHPSLQQYQQLYQSQSHSLICPCTQISTQYKTILYGQYTLHQVCSSHFVTDQWISYLSRARGPGLFWSSEYRVTSIHTFRTLKSLCNLVNETINNSLTRFYATDFVTLDLVPPDIFTVQLQALIDDFWSTTVTDFSLSLQVVQNIIQAKVLLSSLQTDVQLRNIHNSTLIKIETKSYGNCSCGVSAWCIEQSSIYHDYPSLKVLLKVPGMYRGCSLYESLLQSTLECFSDQSCFNNLTSALSQTIQSNASILNATTLSHYSATSTVGEMLKALMVEDWQWKKMYDEYYEVCRPSECQYEVKTRNDVIYIVTTVIGLISGLVTSLTMVVPLVVKLIRTRKTPRRERPGKTNRECFYCENIAFLQ